jgi:hypothetical protein
VIFSRDRGSGKHVRPVVAGKAGRHVRDRHQTDSDDDFDELDQSPPGREYGPFDMADAPEDDQPRVDLGALHVPVLPMLQLGMQGTQDGRAQVIVQDGESALALVAFAAPRSEGIWDEVREEYRQSLAADRANPTEEDGEYGPELHARPRTPGAPTEIRFVGIDGPRWFVQALFQGKAASAGYDGPLRAVLRLLIVDRGTQAMPVREQLPLRLPPQAQAELQAAQAAQAAQSAAANPAPRLTPAQVINSAPPRPTLTRPASGKPATRPAKPAKAEPAVAEPEAAEPEFADLAAADVEVEEVDVEEVEAAPVEAAQAEPAPVEEAADATGPQAAPKAPAPGGARPARPGRAPARPAASRAARGRGQSRGA